MCTVSINHGFISIELFGFVCVVPESRTNMPGIQVHKTPQRPGFAMYEKRLQTFKEWPKNLKQTPEMLAEAGFYYSGQNYIYLLNY